MSLASHLAELQKRHSEIDDEIEKALSSPSIDNIDIVTLKRRKLALKDEIFRLKSGPEARPTKH